MDTKTFLDNFGHIADAPNGVQKLRELILELAVSGNLVPQDSNEESAVKLVENVKRSKESLLEDKKIRPPKELPKISEGELPCELPTNWKWVHIGDVCIVKGGKRVPRGYSLLETETPYVYIRVTDMKNGTVNDDGLRYIDENIYDQIKRYVINKEDIYITIAGTIGAVGIIPEKFDGANLTENAAKLMFRDLNKRYIVLALQSDLLQKQLLAEVNQMAQPKLALKRIETALLPVPPIEEQKRIVAKVDQLMALCDQLETQQKQKAQTRVTLNNAALDKLLTAQNPDEFNHHWQRIANNFHHLYDNLDNLTKLRGSLLDLAVQGRLGTQEAGDTPASEIVEQTKATKEKLITEGKLRKTKAPLFPDYVPSIELPNNWEWSSLYELGEIGPRNQLDDNIEAAFIPMPLISEFYGVPVEYEIRKWGEIKSGFTHFAEGDVALAKITPCYQNGKSCVMRKLKNGVGAGTTELHIFRPINNLVHPDYVLLYLKSPKFIEEGIPKMTGTAGQKRITRDYFAGNHFPLPPIEEQKRIVAKVDQLMALCDQLETKLKQTQTTSEKLVAATVQSLVA